VIPLWPQDIEALETVSQNEAALGLFLRVAELSREGGLDRFLCELVANDELDAETKAAFAEVATNREFLLALDEYVHRTRVLH
jgi:hypothetical protein